MIVTLVIWLTSKSLTGFSTNEKQNQNQSHHVRAIFPTLWTSDAIARNSDWFIALFDLIWLVGIMSLVLIFRQSFENRSKPKNLLLFGWGSGNG